MQFGVGKSIEDLAKDSVNLVGETAGGVIKTAEKGIVFAMVGVTLVGGFYVLGKYVQGTETSIFREGEVFKALLNFAKANPQMLDLLQKEVKAGTGIVPPSVIVANKMSKRYRKLL